MSLLVTSCTMGKQPQRLLNKGPQYLRTRTNASLFGEHRKSAVELLAASKAQFYNIRASVSLDKQQDLAVSVGQQEKYSQIIQITQTEPPRWKSEYNLSRSTFSKTEDDSDENNNNTSNDSITFSKDAVEKVRWSTQQRNNKKTGKLEKTGRLLINSALNEGETSKIILPSALAEKKALTHCAEKEAEFIVLGSERELQGNEPLHENSAVEIKEPYSADDGLDFSRVKRPVPLPRSRKEKPVPPPRNVKTTVPEKDTQLCLKGSVPSSLSLHAISLTSGYSCKETTESKQPVITTTDCEAGVTKKNSLVESLTKRFTALSATSTPAKPKKPYNLHTTRKSETCKAEPDTYTASPVYITKIESQSFLARPVLVNKGNITFVPPSTEALCMNNESLAFSKGRKRCTEVSVSSRAVKRERRSLGSDSLYLKPGFVSSLDSNFVPAENSSSTTKSEMSVESVDQAVCESDFKAIPTASMEAENTQENEMVREVTRSNSCISGTIEAQSTPPLSVSPAPHGLLVPRSLSDIACCLEGQQSRDNPLVSNHSRLSRASIGADLENFFNQMGLEKGALEPMSRLRELQTGEVFDSMSSLDSHDAASLCSTYSRSEQEWNDPQAVERGQQQTSIVERNARIIKWLCNVKKAKGQLQKLDTKAINKT